MLTPEQVAKYIREHPGATTLEIANHFQKSDRYIRKLKAQLATKAPEPTVPTRTRSRLRVIPPPPSWRSVTSIPPASMFQRSDSMIKCPKCRELMHPVPGVDTPETWREGCYLCRSKRLSQENDLQLYTAAPVERSEPEPEPDDQALPVEPAPELGTILLESSTSTVPVSEHQPEQAIVPVEKAAANSLAETQPVRTIVRTIYIRPGFFFLVGAIPGPVLLGIIVGLGLILWVFAGVR